MSETTRSAEQMGRWLRQLRGPDDLLRTHAALRLTGPGIDVEAVRLAMREALQDENAEVRRLAVWVLGRLGQAAAA